MNKEDIINAYVRIRKIDNSIPDDVLDFMKDCSIREIEHKHNCQSCGKRSAVLCVNCVSDIAQETGEQAYNSRR